MTGFTYWKLRSPEDRRTATAAEEVIFDEDVEYAVRLSEPLDERERVRLEERGFRFLDGRTSLVAFEDFVGDLGVAGVPCRSRSRKLLDEGMQRLLQETVGFLAFGWASQVVQRAVREGRPDVDIPLINVLLLRDVMLMRPVGQRLQDWVEEIALSPTTRFIDERRLLPTWEASAPDSSTWQGIVSEPQHLLVVDSGMAFNTALARRLAGAGRTYFPSTVSEPVRRLSFDTPENRFVRNVLDGAAELVDRASGHAQVSAGLRHDCVEMAATLSLLRGKRFIQEARHLQSVAAPSQALQKRAGYREVFDLASIMNLGARAAVPSEEAAHFIDGRRVSSLYETWVFARVVEVVGAVLHREPQGELRPTVRDDVRAVLPYGLTADFGDGIVVTYNETFGHRLDGSYSTALRPDVCLRTPKGLIVLDAKYKMDRPPRDPEQALDAKNDDIVKMHAYRDAISGVIAAFVIYPGTEFRFYERSIAVRDSPDAIANLDGVGAIPLRPGPSATKTAALRRTAEKILLPLPQR